MASARNIEKEFDLLAATFERYITEMIAVAGSDAVERLDKIRMEAARKLEASELNSVSAHNVKAELVLLCEIAREELKANSRM